MRIKDVLQSLVDPRALILAYAKSQGWQAGRLDYYAPTARLYLTALVHGQPQYIPVPLGKTVTAEELADLITQGAPREISPAPDPHGSASPTIVGESPP